MAKQLPPKLKKLSVAKQRQLDELLDKNSEGTISASETMRLKELVAEAEELSVANAKLLAKFYRKEDGEAPPGAVPLTVWVNPQHVKQ
jgi:hypothetical protein